MTRRRFTERDVLATLIWQGETIRCFRCRQPFVSSAASEQCVYDVEREHVHELALGGTDGPENCRYSCHSCHAKITNGAAASSAGSSKNRIAKTRRADKMIPDKRPLDESAVVDAAARCRRCGEYQADCDCRPSNFKNRVRQVRLQQG